MLLHFVGIILAIFGAVHVVSRMTLGVPHPHPRTLQVDVLLDQLADQENE